MWLVANGAKSIANGEPIDPALAETLRLWYDGRGDHIDEKHSLMLVRHARRTRLWLACDCRETDQAPMLSPALLTQADTYYLRRLTGAGRAEHTLACPFYRPQRIAAPVDTKGAPARNKPDSYFAVLKPAPVALSQAPDDDNPVRDFSSHGTPRLAKLLWRLLELSNRSVIATHDTGKRDIAAEFAAIRDVATRIEVAPGVDLERVLFTHPRDWPSKRAFAILRERAQRWPKGYEPQAFLLVFAHTLHEKSIETPDGPIEIATRVRHPGRRDNPIAGPYLVLIAIGAHPDVRGYAAQRAWAQPIHNGHRFVPVENNFDREIVEALLAARRILAREGLLLSAIKPMFDQLTPDGLVRPQWIVDLAANGDRLRIVLTTNEDHGSWHQGLSHIGHVMTVSPDSITRLTQMIKGHWHETNGSGRLPPARQADHQRSEVA